MPGAQGASPESSPWTRCPFLLPPSELTTAPVTASLSPPPSSSSASPTDLVSSQFWKLLIALISLPSGRHTEIAYLISPLSSVGWRGPAGGGGTELLLEGNCGGGWGGPGKLGASTAVGEHQRQASGARRWRPAGLLHSAAASILALAGLSSTCSSLRTLQTTAPLAVAEAESFCSLGPAPHVFPEQLAFPLIREPRFFLLSVYSAPTLTPNPTRGHPEPHHHALRPPSDVPEPSEASACGAVRNISRGRTPSGPTTLWHDVTPHRPPPSAEPREHVVGDNPRISEDGVGEELTAFAVCSASPAGVPAGQCPSAAGPRRGPGRTSWVGPGPGARPVASQLAPCCGPCPFSEPSVLSLHSASRSTSF